MINKKRVVAFVPIKKHSKRLDNKNFKVLGGRLLYQHIFNTLSKIPSIDAVYLYTSEPLNSFTLPKNICYLQKSIENRGDNESALYLIKNFCNIIDSDFYLLAHATNPFTKIATIEIAIDKVINGHYDSALTVEKIKTFSWFENNPVNYELCSVPRTQDIEPIIIETSGFYLFGKNIALDKSRRVGNKPYFCTVEFPETIDIDYQWQLELAEQYLEIKNK